jgi:hypothetical protein
MVRVWPRICVSCRTANVGFGSGLKEIGIMSHERNLFGELQSRDVGTKKFVYCKAVGIAKNPDRPGTVYLIFEGEGEYIYFPDPDILKVKINEMIRVAYEAKMPFTGSAITAA